MKQKFSLIVHIGTGKTGSSSIQKTLGHSLSKLNENGIAYLGLMCENADKQFPWQKASGWPTLNSLETEIARQQLYQVLLKEISQLKLKGYIKAIWSNESLFGNGELVLPVLEKLRATGLNISVIVYIRRHDAWARSAYLQWGIKHKTYSGPLKSFGEWYKSHPISFFSGLRPWLDLAWLTLSVKNFDALDDVVKDFLFTCELDKFEIQSKRENETPHPTALALWSLYNAQFETSVLPIELHKVLEKGGVLTKSISECDFRGLLPTDEDIEFVKEECSLDREKVNKIFERFNQPELSTAQLTPKKMTVSHNQINAALLTIIKNQHEQIDCLNKRMNRFEKMLQKGTNTST